MAARRTRSPGSKETALSVRNKDKLALPAGIRDEFAEEINRDQATATAGGWPYISTVGGSPVMTLNDLPIGAGDGSFEAIILGGVRENRYYSEAYVEGVNHPPTCFAIADRSWNASEVEARLGPPPDLATKQSDKCSTCPMNAFGTEPVRGRAKACKNTVRTALLPADAPDYERCDGAMLSIPPTTGTVWSKYVGHITEGFGRPLSTLVTRIRKIPNERGGGFKFSFEPVRVIQDEDQLTAILVRLKGDAKKALEQLPDMSGGEAPKSRSSQRRRPVDQGARRKRAAKKAGRKAARRRG